MSVLFYLAVGRLVKDGSGEFQEGKHVLVASGTPTDKAFYDADYRTHVKQIMDKGASKLKPAKRIRLTADDNNYDLHVMGDAFGDTLLVYFAVTDTGYGKDHSVPSLLNDFKSGFLRMNHAKDIEKAKEKGSVHKLTLKLINELLSKHGSSKLKDVQNKVEQVKDIMKDNVAKALDNVESLDELDSKAENFESQAKNFEKSAVQVKRMMRCQNWKLNAMIAGVIILIIIIIVASVCGNGGCGGGDGDE